MTGCAKRSEQRVFCSLDKREAVVVTYPYIGNAIATPINKDVCGDK